MSQTLILSHAAPWNGLLSGALLGLITLALLWFKGKALGVSTGFESLCSLGSRLPYFRRKDLTSASSWRLPMTAGLVLGGFASAVFGLGWTPTWALGYFDELVGWGPLGKTAWMFVGGLFIGFGTRLAGGCTSGHGIYGVGNMEKGSFASMASYFAAGMAATRLIYGVFFPGGGAGL